MDFEEPEIRGTIREEVSKLVQSLPTDYFRKKDKSKQFPEELWDLFAHNRWFGVNIPQEFGGAGLGLTELSLVVQTVAASGAGVIGGNLFTVTSAMVPPAILKYGTESLKRSFLPRLAKGELVCAIGITEPSAGVNTLDIDTFAEKRAGEYVIRGQKVWITFAPFSDLILLVARTTRKENVKARSQGLSLFLVDMHDPRIRINPIESLAMRPLLSSEVSLEDVSVPEENLIGVQDRGWSELTFLLNNERVSAASLCLGTGDYVLRRAVEYAKNRIVFGRPIGQNQSIQFPLADSAAKLETARLMLSKATWLYDTNKECAIEANIAAYVSANAAFEAADRAIQTFGGMGFAVETDIERHFRDLRLWRTAPLPEQMVLSLLAQRMLDLPKSY
ncbi:MAG TPA: acyl-CoA dehydrogenase family protein [Nitrososphaerales archaeon]|nr:acyl-CoA dehydrogenase family protein [Nitrososphaerales archaeon]